jgi:hypothetical protein
MPELLVVFVSRPPIIHPVVRFVARSFFPGGLGQAAEMSVSPTAICLGLRRSADQRFQGYPVR